MTTLDTSLCWAVLAPLPVSELRRVAVWEWEHDFPYAIDPQPWEAVPGRDEYAALVSRSPGTEGSDRHFAEIFSTLASDRAVYSLWLYPERHHIFEWRNGKQVASREGDPLEAAESLGFVVARRCAVTPARSVAVVEDASVHAVRRALGNMADEAWIHVMSGSAGVLVTADDGQLGTQAWDIAEALPAATVYYVQRRLESNELIVLVLVLRGAEQIGRFRVPTLDDDTEMLTSIKGAQSPDAIVDALGIPRGILDPT